MSSHLSALYKSNLTLLTDLYQLTMANGYWKAGMHHRPAVFHLFYRNNPFKNSFAIAAGLDLAIDFLQNFHFTAEDIEYLSTLKGGDGQALFESGFLEYLQNMKFECSIDAIPEGSVVFAHEPLIRVRGPLIQAQLLETVLLNIINFSTLIATKASRIVKAAQQDVVLEFGLRRAQGIDGAITGSRAAYIGGCHATSNVLAGKLFGIPVKGTHAHSWVMSFDSEQEAFDTYAKAMPNNSTFLVDTYNTEEGVRNAIKSGTRLRKMGYEMSGIRLDSGNLEELSKMAREMLDFADFPNAAIVASNDLDEYAIHSLKKAGAPITVWGVGTRLITAANQGALNGVYKMSALQDKKRKWQYKMKLSEDRAKVSNPGILQVRRLYDTSGSPIADMIYNTLNKSDKCQFYMLKTARLLTFGKIKGEDLLQTIFNKGKLIYKSPSIEDIRERSLNQQALFEKFTAKEYPVGLEKNLYEEKQKLIDKIQSFQFEFDAV